MGFEPKNLTKNIEFLFSKKKSNQKKKKRNLQKFMLGTSRKFNERSFRLYQLHFMLVQLTPLNFGSTFYPFVDQGLIKNIKYIKMSRGGHTISFA